MIHKKKTFLYDYWSLIIAFLIIAFGLLMVASASMVISDQQFHTPFHFLIHQFAYIFVGLILAIFITRIPITFWETYAPYFLLFSIALLALVLIPGIGKEVNGSVRWIGVGPIGLQVSEFTKFCVIIYMAGFLIRREKEVQSSFSGFIKPIILLALIALLLLLEPDFGAVAVITVTIMGMMFLAGARLWQFVVLLLIVALLLTLLAVVSPYRMLRLTTFMHPWANQFNSGYQLTQSLIAFGRGGIFGVGLGNSIQKLFYLPEAHTDFLFAVLGEELGLVGELLVVGLFIALITRIFRIGKLASVHNKYASYIAYGIGLWIALQAVVNIGVNLGVLPTKGLTLPLMSYGGSSMLLSCAAIAVLLRIYHETHLRL